MNISITNQLQNVELLDFEYSIIIDVSSFNGVPEWSTRQIVGQALEVSLKSTQTVTIVRSIALANQQFLRDWDMEVAVCICNE